MATAVSSPGYHPQNASLVQTPGKAAKSRSGSALTSASTNEDLWSQILTSVETARSTPVCPVVILGEPQSGKSTLVRGLAERCPSGYIEPNAESLDGEAGPSTHSSPTLDEKSRITSRGKRDLGLAYGYCDVPDDEGEGESLDRYILYYSGFDPLIKLSRLQILLPGFRSSPCPPRTSRCYLCCHSLSDQRTARRLPLTGSAPPWTPSGAPYS